MKKITLYKTDKTTNSKQDLYLIEEDNGDIIFNGCNSGPIVKNITATVIMNIQLL